MRTLTATIAAALGCILTAHAQVAVSPGYTPYMATVFLATNSTHARALLEVSSGTATNLASGLHATNLAVLESGGALLKLFGAIGDGEYLKRDGTNVVGGTPAGAGDFMADGIVPMTGVFDAGDNALTNVSAFYGDALTVTNDASVGGLTVSTNATVNNDLFVGNDLTVTNDATVTGDLSVGGTLTVDEVDTDKLVITNSLTVSNMYVNTMVVTNAISGGSLSTTTNVTTAAVTGTNSGTFGTLLSVTNAAITWGVEAVTQSGGTNYTLPFAGTASYPNTYLAYTMTGNVCFAFTTNRAAGRCRTVILYGNGKNGRLDFNADNHLVGTLANGIVVTNTYILSFLTTGTYETNVFISGQYAE
jgi:hypothetical protein